MLCRSRQRCTAGLAWESDELLALNQLLETQAFLTNVGRPVRLEATVHDVYPPSHWAIKGQAPAYDTPDADVYLVGRNAILLSKVAVFCCQHGIGRIAIGSLANNPFPDGTPEFLEAMANALSLGLAHDLSIVAPLTKHHKADVIALGIELKVPLELTLSCMQPENGLHCGLCSKCRERRDAFNEAGVPDLTDYKMPSPR